MLETLMSHPSGPFVAGLPREPGKRESCYAHRFGDEADRAVERAAPPDPQPALGTPSSPEQRTQALETLVSVFREEVDQSKLRVADK